MIDERVINIYTDGSSRPTPRRGGVGIRYIYVDPDGEEKTIDLPLPGYLGATSQEMELQACILALRHVGDYPELAPFRRIIVYTDSKYVVDFYKTAMFQWSRNRWLRKAGAPVVNATSWKELIKEMRRSGRFVDFKKVKGHSSDDHNAAAHRLAKQSAAMPLNPPVSISTVRRKKSNRRTKTGSIQMLGQRITIRIVQGQYLKLQRLYRYRIEVMSRTSPFYRNVDFVCSDYVLREAYEYSVRFNTDQDNPRIVKLYREVVRTKATELPVSSIGPA